MLFCLIRTVFGDHSINCSNKDQISKELIQKTRDLNLIFDLILVILIFVKKV